MQGPGTFTNITANKVVIEGANGEILVYNGAPALGNLSVAIAGMAGNDGLGNSWGPGISSINAGNATSAVVNGGTIGLFAGINEIIGMTFQNFFVGNAKWVFPSGDTSGVKDVANITAALGGGFSAVYLTPGHYYGNTRITIGVGESVIGSSKESVSFSCVGADPGFQVVGPHTPGIIPATLAGIDIDGTGALAGSAGVQVGDLTGCEIDVWVSNFTGGNNGILVLNATSFTEQAKIKARVSNCDGGVALLVTGTGSNSFDRCEFDLEFIQGTVGQNGFVLAAGTVQPVLLEGVLRIHGNFKAGGANSGAVIKFVGATSNIQASRIEVGVECGGGVTGPQTIFFGGANQQITGCYGVMEFFEGGGGTFQASNNNYNCWFDGPITGDNTLITKIPLPATASLINAGFPAGWTGQVTVEVPRGDGQVLFDLQLTVSNGTVVTNGEVILTAAIPTWARPISDKFCAVVVGQAMVPVRVQNTGNVQYLGPGFTGAPTFLFGQMTYLNST